MTAEEINWPTHCLVCGKEVEWSNESWQYCPGHYAAVLQASNNMMRLIIVRSHYHQELSIEDFNRRIKLLAFQ